MKKIATAKSLNAIKDIYQAFLKGYSYPQIYEEFPEKYGVSKRTVERYVQKAKAMLRENCNQDIEDWRALSNERYNDLYRMSLKMGDIETCVKIQNSVDKINGLNEKRVSLEVEKDPFDEFFKVFGGLADSDDNSNNGDNGDNGGSN